MICIEEKTTKKLPGLSSLFITCEYNPNVVEKIKQSGNAIFHKKEVEWEVPVTSLSFLLEELS